MKERKKKSEGGAYTQSSCLNEFTEYGEVEIERGECDICAEEESEQDVDGMYEWRKEGARERGIVNRRSSEWSGCLPEGEEEEGREYELVEEDDEDTNYPMHVVDNEDAGT